MEKNYNSSNSNPAFPSVFTERDQRMLRLYNDIREYFGLTTAQQEQTGLSLNGTSQELDYLLAISG